LLAEKLDVRDAAVLQNDVPLVRHVLLHDLDGNLVLARLLADQAPDDADGVESLGGEVLLDLAVKPAGPGVLPHRRLAVQEELQALLELRRTLPNLFKASFHSGKVDGHGLLVILERGDGLQYLSGPVGFAHGVLELLEEAALEKKHHGETEKNENDDEVVQKGGRQ